ncbi:MAG: hypothetical protein JWO31_2283 [Phycisphaerales bacterium]|nr:hypothetical protein [Phycisphaerales bacterium]
MIAMFAPLAAAALLAQADPASNPPAFHYVPFLKPLPVWGDRAWPWLLLPLCVAVAVVYKSIKCRTVRQVPKEAALLTVWIVAGMLIAAVVLAAIVEGLERANS